MHNNLGDVSFGAITITESATAMRPIVIGDRQGDGPLQVVVFASGGGGNLKAVIDVQERYPDLVRVGAVVTDRLGIPAIRIATELSIPVIARDFEAACGAWADARNDPERTSQYRIAAQHFHDRISEELERLERQRSRAFDLLILSYRRWIHGDLLHRFANSIINQHAGDLTHLDSGGRRKYIGVNPVLSSLQAGHVVTRTSTIMVGEGHDTGEILCQGPPVKYTGGTVTRASAWEHELEQKVKSDWPAIKFAVRAIAEGRLSVLPGRYWSDGSRRILLDNELLLYGGVDLTRHSRES